MDNMINKFKWGGINNSNIFLDENVLRMLSNFRNNFARLAKALIEENKPDSARIVLDKCIELMPDSAVRFDIFMLSIIESYYQIEEIEKANSLLTTLSENVCNDLEYYTNLEDNFRTCLSYEKKLSMHILDQLASLSDAYNQETLKNNLREKFNTYTSKLNIPMY